MRLSEQVQLPTSKILSKLCHASKNLYNLANYHVRQAFFASGNWLRYQDLWAILKNVDAYHMLASQTSQQVLRLLDKNWKSFFNSIKEWRAHPEKFRTNPKPPKYKKRAGEFVVIFTNQQCRIKEGFVLFPKRAGLPPIKTRVIKPLHQVRIVPKGFHYVLEIIYEQEVAPLALDDERMIGIDLGLKNIVTIVNNAGLRPVIIKGGVVKSINQFYNKELARYKGIKDRQGFKGETRRLQKLTRKRNNKISDTFHKISRKVVNYCIENDFGKIIVGYNGTWKQGINIGRKNNQNFVQVPFLKLLHQIKYKAELVGIEFLLQAEAYTSKCSFLDGEAIHSHDTYLGRRLSRGLFKSNGGFILNADVNAGYNIIKKAVPNAIMADGIEGVGFHPYSIAIL